MSIFDSKVITTSEIIQSLLKPVQEKVIEEVAEHFVPRKKGHKRPFVKNIHKRRRKELGLGYHDLKNMQSFPISQLPVDSKTLMPKDVVDELALHGIRYLSDLTTTSKNGIRYRFCKAYGQVNQDDQFLNYLVDTVAQSLSYLGYKFSNFHPHREFPDGSLKPQVKEKK